MARRRFTAAARAVPRWPMNRRQFMCLPAAIPAEGLGDHGGRPSLRSGGLPWEVTARFWERFDLQIIDSLGLSSQDRVLDAGCGYGNHLVMFARTGAAVFGFDRDEQRIGIARRRLREAGLAERVELQVGDLFDQPYPSDSMSLIWCSHVLHGLADLPRAARILAAMTAPGGRLVVRENRVGQSWLPYDIGVGEPGLEHRLEAAFLRWFLEDRRRRGRYPHGWTHLLRKTGLVGVHARSFLHELEPPFDRAQQEYLGARLRRLAAFAGVSEADRQLVERLLHPNDPAYVFLRDDLYFLAVSTIYVGRKPP